MNRRLREAAMLVLLSLAVYLMLSLATFSPDDPGWSSTGAWDWDQVRNQGGPAGAWFADVLLSLFGLLSSLVPIMIGWSGWLIFRDVNQDDEIDLAMLVLRWSGFLCTLGAGSTLMALHVTNPSLALPMGTGAGGALGDLCANLLVHFISPLGITLIMSALFLGGFTLFTGVSWIAIVDVVGGTTLWVIDTLLLIFDRLVGVKRPPAIDDAPQAPPPVEEVRKQRTESRRKKRERLEGHEPARIEPVFNEPQVSERVDKERQLHLFDPDPEIPESTLPPLALLDGVPPRKPGYSPEALEALSRQVELKLLDFGVDGRVTAVLPGPVVTMFELDLAAGTKASKVTGLARDLARSLSTISVRVVEVIPGKSVIGLEIPNESRETVFLTEMLQSDAYDRAKSPLTLAMGKDISGQPVVADLAKMPHALIAGTTGSGKSVAINAMILSLLYKATPKEVRLIMVDPKMLELSVYEGIPHLLTPVVTDMNEAANALRWSVAEMERRYRLMASLGVRNITGYNRMIREAAKKGEPIPDPMFQPDPFSVEPQLPPALEEMPYIVVVIDELADLMMVVGKKVEELIARLAQKARAAGIHLLLATQRPSVDVITGLIKANIPARIGFQVSSRIDSRTILDQMGAEQLLGNGDMLYLPPGTSIPQRLHGAFVDDAEVHRVVDFLRRTGEPDYIIDVVQDRGDGIPGLTAPIDGQSSGDVEDTDPLFDEAVRIVTESRRASISNVQRRLKIGYNRAARLIEEMERIGIVSAAETNGNREVLAAAAPADD